MEKFLIIWAYALRVYTIKAIKLSEPLLILSNIFQVHVSYSFNWTLYDRYSLIHLHLQLHSAVFLSIEFLNLKPPKMVYNYSISYVESRTSLSNFPANILFTLQRQVLIGVERCNCNKKNDSLQIHNKDICLGHFLWNCSQMDSTRSHKWLDNIASDTGLVICRGLYPLKRHRLIGI